MLRLGFRLLLLLLLLYLLLYLLSSQSRIAIVTGGAWLPRMLGQVDPQPSLSRWPGTRLVFPCVCFGAMASASIRSSLRSILRSVGHKSERGVTILTEFRESRHIQDQKQLQKLQNIAHDYAEMLAATREKHRLIILDSGAERY